MPGLTVTKTVHLATGRRGRQRIERGSKPEPVVHGPRVPRAARLMALAIRLEGLLKDGTLATQADAARIAGVTRARVTQILNLNLLAPDIQCELLAMRERPRGRDSITERQLRDVVRPLDWDKQRARWSRLVNERWTARGGNEAGR